VLVLEELVLVVADDDQRVELGLRDLRSHALHRLLHLVVARRDRFVRDQLGDVRGCPGEHLRVGARLALAIVVLHAQVALTESAQPILELGREHHAVGGTEGRGELGHA